MTLEVGNVRQKYRTLATISGWMMMNVAPWTIWLAYMISYMPM